MKPEMALKNALLEIISCMLSPNSEERRIAEERKKALEVTDEYSIHLLEILLSAEEALEERQMAAILLKQYVRNHWSEVGDEFVPPLANDFVKGKIKEMLPMGLTDQLGKIQNHIAYILATIAAYDYPDNWPNMCDAIFSSINLYGSTDCLGVLAFINEYRRSATHYQINACVDRIYAALVTICKQTVKYSTKVRAAAVSSLCNVLYKHSLDVKERQKLINTGTLTKFCQLLAMQLVLPHPEQSDYELKSEILIFCTMLLTQMPDAVVETVIFMMPNIWQIVARCEEMYDQVLAHEIPPYRDPSENLEDAPRFYVLAFHVFDILYTLVNTQQGAAAIVGVLPHLLYYMILFMSIPKEIELLWRSDPDIYINDDLTNDGCLDSSVRVLSKGLLMLITEKLEPANVLKALTMAVDKHLHLCKGKSESYYWRIMESTMYAVGSIKTFIVRQYQLERLHPFNIMEYLRQWAGEIGPCPSWLMLARILWIGGQYAILLEGDILSTYLMTTIHNLRESSFILRYSAMRALSLHVDTMTQSEFQWVYIDIRDPIVYALIYALEHSEGEIVHVGLQTLGMLLKPQSPTIEAVQDTVITLVLNLFLKNLAFPKIVGDLHVIVQQLCENSNSLKNLENRFLPVIMNVINDTNQTENRTSGTFESHYATIELLTKMVRHSQAPFSDELIRCVFSVCRCMVAIEDSGVTQSGADCIRTYLCKTSQVIAFIDHEGFTGTDYILNVVRHFLDPQKMELYCKQVGRLCITAIHTLGTNLDAHIGVLVKDILSAMQRSKDTSVEESLLVIFACLFYTHLETVIHYLTLIPGPGGESALTYVFNGLLSKQHAFDETYQCNINILAFTKMIEYTVLKQDQRVADIKVRGDPIPSFVQHDLPESEHVATHFTEVPVLLKMLKFLLLVMQKELEHRETATQLLDTATTSETVPLHVLEAELDREYSDNSESDCQDNDSTDIDSLDGTNPIYSMKRSDFLTNFMKDFAQTDYFIKCVQFLDDTEKETLLKMGVTVGI